MLVLMVFVQWVMYLFFSVYNVCGAEFGVSVCVVLKLADLCVCEISQSQHQLAQGTLTYAQLLVFEGFVMVCVGVASLRCFQNLMALFGCFRRRGYWPNSALHPLFGVFVWTRSILYRNLNVEFRSGVFPNLRSQIL